jgi:phage terminase Nu1 subunit (DNA packaging protein)
MNVHDLTQKQIAELFAVTPRSIRDWHAEGFPRLETGNYDGAACVAWFASRDGEFADQRQRLAAAQAEKAEAENAIRRGELLQASDVGSAWSEMIAAARAKFLSMPTKLGPQIANVGDVGRIAEIIRAEVHEALAELAEYKPDPAQSGEDVDAASAADGLAVGRRKPKVKH